MDAIQHRQYGTACPNREVADFRISHHPVLKTNGGTRGIENGISVVIHQLEEIRHRRGSDCIAMRRRGEAGTVENKKNGLHGDAYPSSKIAGTLSGD
jgi:hypothetical protein